MKPNYRADPDPIHLYKRILTKLLKRIINCSFSNKASQFSTVDLKRLFSDLAGKFFKSNDCSRLSDIKPLKLFNTKRLIELQSKLADPKAKLLYCYILLMLPVTGTFLKCDTVGFIEMCCVVEHVLLNYCTYILNNFTS
jgi:hypothetical protein